MSDVALARRKRCAASEHVVRSRAHAWMHVAHSRADGTDGKHRGQRDRGENRTPTGRGENRTPTGRGERERDRERHRADDGENFLSVFGRQNRKKIAEQIQETLSQNEAWSG